MRRYLIGIVIVAAIVLLTVLLFNPGVPAPQPTPTPSPAPATLTPTDPAPATATPEPTTAPDGLFLDSVEVLQADPISGELVALPSEDGDADRLYTYDGNQVMFRVTVGNNGTQQPVARLVIEDQVLGEVIADQITEVPPVTGLKVSLMWDTLNAAWTTDETPEIEQAGLPMGARTFVVQLFDGGGVEVDSASRVITVRPRPVVLVHGWRSSVGIWEGYVGYLNTIFPGWLGLPADNLSTGGARPFEDARWNADRLNEYIAAQQSETGAQHVDVVSHSMGGLIARAYLHSYDAPATADERPTVLRLVMLGTPNQGSPCANIGAVLHLFTGALDGAWHFTPEYISAFNLNVTQTNGTRLTALGGTDIWTCGATGDGIVPVGSATSYGTDNLAAALTAHIRGVTLWEILFGARDYEYSEAQFNAFVLPHLLAPWEMTSAPARPFQAQAAPPEEADAPPVTQRYALTIPPASRAVTSVIVYGGDEAGIVFAPVSGVSAALRDRQGNVIASLTEAELESLPVPVLPYRDAAPGVYSLDLTNNSPETTTVHLAVFERGLDNDLMVEVEQDDDGVVLLATVVVNGDVLSGAEITVHVGDVEVPDGENRLLAQAADTEGFTDRGGTYRLPLDLPPGTYAVAVQARVNGYTLTEQLTVEVPEAEADED